MTVAAASIDNLLRARDERTRSIPGERLGRLVALRPVGRAYGRTLTWLFRCDCGTEVERPLCNVRQSVKRKCVPRCGPDCTLGARQDQRSPGASKYCRACYGVRDCSVCGGVAS